MDRFHEWEFAKNYEQFRIRKTCGGKAAIRVLHPGELHTCGNVIRAYLIGLEWMLLLGLFSLGTSE